MYYCHHQSPWPVINHVITIWPPYVELVRAPNLVWPGKLYHKSLSQSLTLANIVYNNFMAKLFSQFHCQFSFSDLGQGWRAEFDPRKHFNAPASAELAAVQGFGE